MNLEVAQLVPGTETPVGEGINEPARCLIRTQDGEQRLAVLKRIPTKAIAAEAFCALVLRAWGLHVHQPFVIEEDGAVIGYASADDGYPNLKQRMGLTIALPDEAKEKLVLSAAQLIAKFSQTPLAIAADEAIDNQDRNLGNILWDGLNVVWIDHEGAMGIRQEDGQNKLAALMCLLDSVEPTKVAAVNSAHGIQHSPHVDAEATAPILFSGLGFGNTLTGRLNNLAADVLKRFPQPQDLLSNQ